MVLELKERCSTRNNLFQIKKNDDNMILGHINMFFHLLKDIINFRLRSEHKVCCPLGTYFHNGNSIACVDLYRVSYSKPDSADFAKSDDLSRQNMLTSQTNF